MGTLRGGMYQPTIHLIYNPLPLGSISSSPLQRDLCSGLSNNEIMSSSSSEESNGRIGYRHTTEQIDVLERMFQSYPNPNEAQRMQLSMELGMEPRQVKFWFQNRRTQMKVQVARDDSAVLRAANDRLRADNAVMEEALKNSVCYNCCPPPAADSERRRLRMKNIRLKEEFERLSNIITKYLGMPTNRLPALQAVPISPLDQSVDDSKSSGCSNSVDINLLPPGSLVMSFPSPTAISETGKQIMLGIATTAMEELIKLVQASEPLWIKIGRDGKEVLNLDIYDIISPGKSQRFKRRDILIETSRGSGVVMADTAMLVDMFMDSGKWVELFPTIVAQARTFEVLSTGTTGSKNGCLVLMYEEQQVLSPVVPTRKFCFLRFCQQIDLGLWMIADVSVKFPNGNQLACPSVSRKLPSGCLIKDMSNGYSMINWVEHVEVDARNPIDQLYRDLVHTGMAFGAQRWLSALQRMCERHACLRTTEISPGEFGLIIASLDGKRRVMKLAQKMMINFCTSLSASDGHQWATLSGLNDIGVRIRVRKNNDPSQHHVVIGAATSVWLPLPSYKIFNFLRDKTTRSQWDIISNGFMLEEVAHISNGSIPGNYISLFQVNKQETNHGSKNMLILQECCTDNWGSIMVYSSLDLPSMNAVISGQLSSIKLLPSGITVQPDGPESTGWGASTSSNPMGGSAGSLVTVSFQILASILPSSELNHESITTINHLISSTVQRIKVALNCLPVA